MNTEIEWEMVRSALKDSKWDFRTVDGVARDTGLDLKQVEEVIDCHRSEVRQTISRDGIVIYAHKSKPVKAREIIAQMQRFASKAF